MKTFEIEKGASVNSEGASSEDTQAASLIDAESILSELASVFFPADSSPQELASRFIERRKEGASQSAELLQLTTRYQILVEQIPAVVFIAYLDQGIGEAYVSPQIEAMLGFSQEEWLNDPIRWYQQVHPDDKERWSIEAAQMFLTGEPLRSVYRVLARDGRVVWFQCEAKMVRRDDGRPWFIHGVGFDISEVKQAEETLRNAHHELEVRVAERTGELARANAAMQMEVAVRRQAEDALRLAHDELEKRVAERTVELSNANASLREQIAERKRAEEALSESEEQLRQSQKLEAVGQLAGGIAHDFNNLLTVISGYTALSLRKLSQDDPMRRNIEEVKKAAERAASLTRQLLAFSRKQMLQPKLLDLNDAVTNTNKMLQRLIGEDIQLVMSLMPSLGRIRADPGQLDQVLMNLAVNARDAMPQGGQLTIETANVEIDEELSRKYASVQPGLHVLLTISDTGCGMSVETQERIFEPFYTTKEVGKGTGLGLSTVYGIIKQSEGYITVESGVGHGTSFKIYLPRVIEATKAKSDEEAVIDVEPPRGSETVLLVEDEETVRRISREILEMCGYTVLEAANGKEALLVCQQHEGQIHAVVTDVVMPEMSGRELVEHLSPLRPAMRVLYMSGYTDDARVHHGVSDAGLAFLQKPFTPDALAHKLREVLDAS